MVSWSRKGPDHGVGVDPETVNLHVYRSWMGPELPSEDCLVLLSGSWWWKVLRSPSWGGTSAEQNCPKIQRKTKGQQLKGKIVSALFHTFWHFSTLFHTFSEFFRIYTSRTFS